MVKKRLNNIRDLWPQQTNVHHLQNNSKWFHSKTRTTSHHLNKWVTIKKIINHLLIHNKEKLSRNNTVKRLGNSLCHLPEWVRNKYRIAQATKRVRKERLRSQVSKMIISNQRKVRPINWKKYRLKQRWWWTRLWQRSMNFKLELKN